MKSVKVFIPVKRSYVQRLSLGQTGPSIVLLNTNKSSSSSSIIQHKCGALVSQQTGIFSLFVLSGKNLFPKKNQGFFFYISRLYVGFFKNGPLFYTKVLILMLFYTAVPNNAFVFDCSGPLVRDPDIRPRSYALSEWVNYPRERIRKFFWS